MNREAEANGTEQIKNFCPHMARHRYTSIAYSAGADVKIVSQILGHSSAAVTMDVYAHLTVDKRREQKGLVVHRDSSRQNYSNKSSSRKNT